MLTRTCHGQLSHLSGTYSDAEADWMRAISPDLLSDYDLAETPLAKLSRPHSLMLSDL